MSTDHSSLFYHTRCIPLKRVASLRGPSPRHCARATQFVLKKCPSSSEPLATLCPISLARDSNLRPPAIETNALPLDQQVVDYDNYTTIFKKITNAINFCLSNEMGYRNRYLQAQVLGKNGYLRARTHSPGLGRTISMYFFLRHIIAIFITFKRN